jgi:catechol 2,3-dioxygenase-like lactoylglutathione lyase family enzyme
LATQGDAVEIKELGHLVLYVRVLDRSVRFYRDGLMTTDFRAGCPVLAVAVEAGDPDAGAEPVAHAAAAFDFDFRQEINDIFGTTVQFRMPFLPSKALDFRHGQPLNPGLLKRFLHLVKLEGLNDRLDLLHGPTLPDYPFPQASDHFPAGRTIGQDGKRAASERESRDVALKTGMAMRK